MLRAHLLLATVVLGASLSTPPCFAAEASPAGANATADSVALHRLFEDYFERQLQLNPLLATFIGDHRYDDKLTNTLSPEHIALALSVDRKALADAQKLAARPLPEADRLSVEIFMYDLRASIEGAKFPGELAPINQFQSLPTLMPVLGSGTSAQPFGTTADYERFLKRMHDYTVWSDQAITNMRKGLKEHVTYPRVLMAKVLPQLQALIVADPQASLFYAPLKKFPDAVPAADRPRLQAAYRDAIAQEINPAYQRLHDFIRDEYLAGARTQVGWSSVPNGREWYSYLARLSTTTDLSPDAIHELGLKEVARIRGEMEQVKAQVGFKGDLAAFFKFLQDDPRFYYDNADALIQGYRDLKKNIDARLPKLFADFPKADYEVRAVEPFRAASSAGGFYQQPSADGSRPGIFYVNTFNLKAQPKFGMETLSLHEAAPGHHFQTAIQQELHELPRFRRFGNGYVAYQEGWALYAESLGKELGMFTDPYQYYGRLSDEMLRAMRLVVDTGLHTRNWTREQSIKYMLDNSSMAPSDAEAEVERYIAIPGQALGYKIGQLRIRELRNKAEAALGSRFDVREFHSVVLRDGSLPLGVLETKIDRWIASKK
ncbi:MAG TPA: DUF885 domain-containing protein [Steroidobacteraceae bacterium]|nr:DUF885 domain-containing protein [Steroidobacteraceae bacterium]